MFIQADHRTVAEQIVRPLFFLLAALESHNVEVEYQCREGYCGSCRTRLVAGQVDWITEPLAFIQPGEILPCCCRAKGDIEIEM
ncbi:2Fe-2S ferredoxin [Salmonella enterica subsp. enterica serovar Infantis]|nr:2Fe-2S ferredoxin [Salmonella enterica subsp. enterica serovar Infantis]